MASHEPSSHNQNRPHLFLILTLVFSLFSSVHAQYFIIDQPSGSTSWANGSPFPVSWTMGLLDDIASFDVELTRLNEDGLLFVALNVPASYNALNIVLQDVPEGDDYFLLCMNTTHSLIHAISARFKVTNSTASQNPSPNPLVPTVTVFGAPNPLQQFAATLGPQLSSGSSVMFSPRSSLSRGFGCTLVLCAVLLGGAMAF